LEPGTEHPFKLVLESNAMNGAQGVEALAKVLELTGAWVRSEEIVGEARATAVGLADTGRVAWCDTALAEAARKQGRYDEAGERLAAARTGFEGVGADDGLGQVLHLAGTLAAQRGDYAAARERYLESLPIRHRLGDRSGEAALYSNLGVVAEYSGDYAAARTFNERALAVRTELGDRWAIGVSQNNLGMIALHERRFAEARACFEESMRLNREVGDAWMVAIGHNNLGNAARGLGDLAAARASYAQSLRAYQAYDDRWPLVFPLEYTAILGARLGAAERAFELLGAAETMRTGINSPRGAALEEELNGHLAQAMSVIGTERANAAVLRGRRLDTGAAVKVALELCLDAPGTITL